MRAFKTFTMVAWPKKGKIPCTPTATSTKITFMGVPGMILAPVILHYVKSEASRVAVEHQAVEAAQSQPSGS